MASCRAVITSSAGARTSTAPRGTTRARWPPMTLAGVSIRPSCTACMPRQFGAGTWQLAAPTCETSSSKWPASSSTTATILRTTTKFTSAFFGHENGNYWHRNVNTAAAATYDISVVNTLVWGYKLTGDVNLLNRARVHFRQGTRWAEGRAGSIRAGPAGRSNRCLCICGHSQELRAALLQSQQGAAAVLLPTVREWRHACQTGLTFRSSRAFA